MEHEHGAVPGPTTTGGKRPASSARPGQRAASAQGTPPAPLGYGEEASENTGSSENTPAPVPEKYSSPSAGGDTTRTAGSHRGGGYVLIPGEDS